MNPIELLKAGKLQAARHELGERVRKSPGDTASRTLLFQVLCFCGQWDKAERHLDVLAALEPDRETGVQVFKNLIQCEKEREQVWSCQKRPAFAPHPPPYAELYFDILGKVNSQDIDQASNAFADIDQQRPELRGAVNGQDFSGFRDTDTLLSFFIEAMVYDRYVWIPVEAISEWTIAEPKTLFDLLWAPARIKTWEELSLQCFVPVLYPGSHEHEDERVRMGRVTDWIRLGGNFIKGMGQHVYETNDREVALLEIRELVFEQQVE